MAPGKSKIRPPFAELRVLFPNFRHRSRTFGLGWGGEPRDSFAGRLAEGAMLIRAARLREQNDCALFANGQQSAPTDEDQGSQGQHCNKLASNFVGLFFWRGLCMRQRADYDQRIAQGPSVGAIVSSLTAFLAAAARPPTPLARAIVLVLVIKLIAIAGIKIFMFPDSAQPNVDATAMARVVGPHSTVPLTSPPQRR